jgi:hypothetical protein
MLNYFVIASEAKQSRVVLRESGLLRFARNDDFINSIPLEIAP